jgi:hypothetical protein
MCLKIRCDGKSEKFCKIFWELNRASQSTSFLNSSIQLAKAYCYICSRLRTTPVLAKNTYQRAYDDVLSYPWVKA